MKTKKKSVKFLHVKVGDNNCPATDEDIKDMVKVIEDFKIKNRIYTPVIVTHHAVKMAYVELEEK